MKKSNYILGEVKKILKNKNLINSGYAEAFYSVYIESFDFSYADDDWINKDNIFTDNEEISKAFCNLLKINSKNYYDLPLSSVIGSCLGAKKINNKILTENKKSKILNYKNYLVCDYEKLKTGDYLSGAYYIKDKELDNLIVIAIKNGSDKESNLINIYEECGFTVNELKSSKTSLITDAIKTAKKSKNPYLIIVSNNEEERDFSKFEEFDYYVEVRNRTNLKYKKWLLEYDTLINEKNEKILDIINYLKNPIIGIDLENIQFNLDANYENTLTNSSDKIFGILLNKSEYILNVEIKDDRLASLISIGLAISGFKPSLEISNFKDVCDIVNLANSHKLPINFILKHTDEEVYSKNLNIFIPSDMHEVIGSWSNIVKLNKTSVIILSNKETTLVKNTNLKYVKYGAYMIKKETGALHGIIVSFGEDLKLALGVAGLLEKEDLIFRVVTMPCSNLLLKQKKYLKELLNSRVKIFVLDKTLNVENNKFSSNSECLISSELGLDKVKEKIKEELGI